MTSPSFPIVRSLLGVSAIVTQLMPGVAICQARQYPLESANGLVLHNATAEPATLNGKRGVRLTIGAEALARFERMSAEEQAQFEQLAVIEGSDFSSGTIEVELAGTPAPGAGAGARGFVGIAFRLQKDMRTYDAFYVRPTNGRAEDQERRNHATQYISHPEWPWFRLRRDTPSKYESYVDLVPGEWTRIRIEVRGEKARLFVHGQEHPSLIVNDVKSGAQKPGTIALWLGPGTIAHFRNLTVNTDRATQ
ncbi:MAG: family 16 glycoside hydrolase [Gemmatimonadaceae bacterium]